MTGTFPGADAMRPSSAPAGDLAICPHCWMVNPGAFVLCARCGADMNTFLQESGGLRRTAPIQSPVPVGVGRLSRFQRATVGVFLVVLTAGYLALFFLPVTGGSDGQEAAADGSRGGVPSDLPGVGPPIIPR